MNWIAIWVTFKLAALTALILLVVGLPIAYWVSFSRRRWKFIVESVVALPLVLPPTVLGFYILVAIGPHSPFGRFYNELVGHPLPFHLRRPPARLHSLQPSVCGATVCRGVRAGRSAIDRGLVDVRGVQTQHIFQAHHAFVQSRIGDRRGAEFCSYHG